MAHTQFPSCLSQDKREFISAFYKASDDPTSVDEYLSFLTEDVHFTMGLKDIRGSQGVRSMRETMWTGVSSRHHKPEKVYSFDDAGSDLMIHGTVDYGLSSGASVDGVRWAARMVFSPNNELRMSHYQVWLDASTLTNALKQQG